MLADGLEYLAAHQLVGFREAYPPHFGQFVRIPDNGAGSVRRPRGHVHHGPPRAGMDATADLFTGVDLEAGFFADLAGSSFGRGSGMADYLSNSAITAVASS